MQSMLSSNNSNDTAIHQAALDKTMKEVGMGTMGAAISVDTLDAKYNGLWNLYRRFGLRREPPCKNSGRRAS
eukprot:4914373-Heterocapsa_arctica.AAC.1